MAIHRYAAKFSAEHPPPDWIELKDLRQGEPVNLNAVKMVGDSPVAGDSSSTRVKVEDINAGTIKPWIWGDAVWHYADGKEVVYPAYDKIDWAKQ